MPIPTFSSPCYFTNRQSCSDHTYSCIPVNGWQPDTMRRCMFHDNIPQSSVPPQAHIHSSAYTHGCMCAHNSHMYHNPYRSRPPPAHIHHHHYHSCYCFSLFIILSLPAG
eukprot:XP_014774736.1 PREDICTED: uncharacterized protein LOC106872309 [Octopus bimaculoides]